MTDDDHLRAMLAGGERGRIERLWETRDAWGFGGRLWIAKAEPLVKYGPMDRPDGTIERLTADHRFERTRFHLGDTGASGWAIWFQRGPRDAASESLDNRTLCGWVSLDREAEVTAWLAFLDLVIARHLEAAQVPGSDDT